MVEYDTLYCSITEKVSGDIDKFGNYLNDSKWRIIREVNAPGDVKFIHLAKSSASIIYYCGKNWMYLSVTDLIGTKTIDKLLVDNPILNERNARRFERKIINVSE